MQPFFLWVCFAVNIAFILIKGPKDLRVKPVWLAVVVAAVAGMVLIPVFYLLSFAVGRLRKTTCRVPGVQRAAAGIQARLGLDDDSNSDDEAPNNPSLNFVRTTNPTNSTKAQQEAQTQDAPVKAEQEAQTQGAPVKLQQEAWTQDAPVPVPVKRPSQERRDDARQESETYFVPLLIFSALSVACAHGGNDVGNAVGPLSAIVMVMDHGEVSSKPDIEWWALLYGTVGFVLGIVTMGRLTIKTVGTKLTVLSPSKSFATQMGGAVAVLGSSALGLPVSTSHCLVGSVVGIGAFEAAMKTGHLNLGMLSRILLAWGMTIPLAMILATICFLPFKDFFD
jgi:phosphate/sulfate permease